MSTQESRIEAQEPAHLYAEIQAQAVDNKMPPSMAKRFAKMVYRGTLAQALLPKCMRPTRHDSVQSAFDFAERNGMFEVDVSGAEHLRDADLILGNHQGPREGQGTGGLECLFAWNLIPEHTRIVLRENIVHPEGFSLKKKLLGRAIGNSNPLLINTTNSDSKTFAERREGYAALKDEREQTARAVFKLIEEGNGPVLLYPEGTRSPTGALLPFVSTFFRHAVEEYLIPRIRSGRDINIGLVVADTLQVFPRGLGTKVDMFRKKLTMKGMQYDPEWVIEKMTSIKSNLELNESELRQATRVLLDDVRRVFIEELQQILVQALPMEAAV